MHDRKAPLLAVDAFLTDGRCILLIKRKNEPYSFLWALPGGFVKYGESVEEAAVREVHEETGITISSPLLIGIFSNPGRDPRGHVVSCAFFCKTDISHFAPGSDAAAAKVFNLDNLPDKLAFDHKEIIEQGKRLL
ncbi:MAG: NUDIX domain-containing protein [Candidatus Methanofastidiosia archaeon]